MVLVTLFSFLALSKLAFSQCPSIPSLSGYSNAALPNPFTFYSGTPVTTTSDWACRRAEVSQMLQTDELGALPGPPTSISPSLSGNTLNIVVNANGKSVTFSPTITYPSSGTAPYPAIVALDGGSIPAPAGVAMISFNTGDWAQQDSSSSRGLGKYYTLFGSGASAGAMMAWAWGISRIVDALVQLGPTATRIDTSHLGVTGCSRDGKGALVAGAFEPRFVLTIPQESGSGGTDSWRVSDYLLKNGLNTQTASEIIGENVWFSTAFNQFAQSSTNNLPFDHHQLAGLVAPRGLFVIDNVGYDWLGPFSSWAAMTATRTIYQALGATSNIGVSQAASHSHCVFPSSQQTELNSFVNRFLFGQNVATNVWETAGTSAVGTQWINWANITLVNNGGGSTTTTSTTPGGGGGTTTTTTTTTATATTTTTTKTIASTTPPLECSPQYGQCGGIGWAGYTCCESGFTCHQYSAYYSQCL